MTEPARASFELNEEMLGLIEREFSIQQLVNNLAQAISGKQAAERASLAQDIFTSYGVDWIRRSQQLGEEYPDRTYQVLKEAIDATGGELWFPLLPQRVLEIAYLSIQDMEFLPVIENNPRQLVYRIDRCQVFRAIREGCGDEVANGLPCQHACLSALHTLFHDLDFSGVLIEMEAATNQEGYCQFVVTRT